MTIARARCALLAIPAGMPALFATAYAASGECPTPNGIYVTPGKRAPNSMGSGTEHGASFVRIGSDRFFADGQPHLMPDSQVSYQATCADKVLQVALNVQGRNRTVTLRETGNGNNEVRLREGDAGLTLAYDDYQHFQQPAVHKVFTAASGPPARWRRTAWANIAQAARKTPCPLRSTTQAARRSRRSTAWKLHAEASRAADATGHDGAPHVRWPERLPAGDAVSVCSD